MGFWNTVLKGVIALPIIMIVLNLFLIIIPEDIVLSLYNTANYFGSLLLYIILIFGSLALLIKFVQVMRENFEIVEMVRDIVTFNYAKAFDRITDFLIAKNYRTRSF